MIIHELGLRRRVTLQDQVLDAVLVQGGGNLEAQPFGRLWGRARENPKVDEPAFDPPTPLVGANRVGVRWGSQLGAPDATLEPNLLP